MGLLPHRKPLVCILLCLLMGSCKPALESKLALEADSLVMLTLELQQRISSSDIQRLSEFQDEILLDLDSMDHKDDPSVGGNEFPGPASNLIKQYMALNQDLAHCLEACNQYHEEAFMLETTLQDIKQQAVLKGANQEVLKGMLEEEWSVYFDLASRIDSGIENVNHHSRAFYSLKPDIDSVLSLD